MRQPDLAAKADDELAAMVYGELQALVGAREPPLWTDVTRWTRAIPQYNLGHREHLRAIEEAERPVARPFVLRELPRRRFVGDRIQAARAAADRIVAARA
jgi:oxygen-dependent protoporphyrinogen oxidase